MNITATTTDEQVLAQVHHAKQELAALAAKLVDDDKVAGERLLGMAQNVVSAEAVARAQLGYRNVLANNPDNALPYLFDLVARGADDGWSGRKNDSKRSAHDAVTAWARDAAWELRS